MIDRIKLTEKKIKKLISSTCDPIGKIAEKTEKKFG